MRILISSYKCVHFAGNCAGVARWDPDAGFVPRGFVGALGRLEDVQLVLMLAEPGNGLPAESHPFRGDPNGMIEELCEYVFRQYESPATLFHRNVRYILDQCWPGQDLHEQLTRTWITETYLCSAPVSTGAVSPRSWRTCVSTYLAHQLALLDGRVIVALGGKAQQRSAGLPGVHYAFAPAPPGCNQRGARPSWNRIGALVHERYQA